MKKNEKKKIIIAAIVLIIPCILIGVIVYKNFLDDLGTGKINECIVSFGENQNSYYDEETIAVLYSAVENGEKVDEPAKDVESYCKAEFEFKKIKVSYKYTFLLSASSSDCLFVGDDGDYCRIPSEIAEKILAVPFVAENVMGYVNPPTVSLESNGKTVTSSVMSGSWNVKNGDGKITNVGVSENGNSTQILEKSNEILFSSSVKPDFCDIKILDENDEILFTGDSEKLREFSLESDRTLKINVKCEWFQTENTPYFGEIEYLFDVFYDVPASAFLSSTDVKQGGTVVVMVKDSGSENLALTSKVISGRPEFISGGNRKIAFVNIPLDAEIGETKLSLLGSDIEKEFTVNIYENSKPVVTVPNDLSGNKQSVISKVKDQNQNDEFLATDGLCYPIPESNIEIQSCAKCDGGVMGFISFVPAEKTNVNAAGTGKVAYCGSIGSFDHCVIISHGAGVFSVYLSLDELNVSKDEIVIKDIAIGLDSDGFYYAVFSGETLADTESIIDSGYTF